jgi:uncharacterized protein YgbK (DUF1537 family)
MSFREARPVEVAVIADDLTGAADCGVQFARAGYRTAIAFGGEPMPPSGEVNAVVVDTDSRLLSPELARERVLEAGGALKGVRISYKKLDSTLRGPVAAELSAALAASGRPRAVIAPAFPGAGRTTAGGVQLVHGVPIHETGLAEDPRTPVREVHIPSLLAREGLKDVYTLGVAELQDAGLARRALGEHRWVVADAETDAHLLALVRAAPDPSAVLWAGSAGLAQALGAVYPGPHEDPAPVLSPCRRVLVVAGSANRVAREQLGRLEGEPGVALVELASGSSNRRGGRAVEDALGAARAFLDGGVSVALYPADEEGDAESIVRALAEVVAGLSEEGRFDALVLTGGDTAVRVARGLGASGIMLHEELETGVPVGTLIGPRPYRVVTKAGGFGEPETLLNALRFLTGAEERTGP